MNRMTFAYSAGLAFGGGPGAWYTVSWYNGRGPRDRKRVRKVVVGHASFAQVYEETISRGRSEGMFQIEIIRDGSTNR